jgi:hypothetical protein
MQAPTADVVEVVRCRDCKYHHNLEGGVKCERLDGLLMTLPNDYCSYGRRKMELNVEQIKKALECCKIPKLTKCYGCPREEEDSLCMYRLNEDTLALINELTAKNDAVSEECCQLLTKVRKLTEENERLKAELASRPPKLIITKVNKEDTDAHQMEQTE